MAQQSAEELKRIKMFTESIGKSMDDLAAKQEKRNKSLAEEARLVKKITEDLSDEEATAKAIAKVEARKLAIQQKAGGQLSKNQKTFIANLNATQKSLGVRLRESQVISQTQTQIEGVTDSLKSGFDSAASSFKEIPVIGGALASPFEAASKSVGLMGQVASEQFASTFSAARTAGKSFEVSQELAMNSVTKSVGSLAKAIFTGPVIAMLAVTAVIGLAIASFAKLESAAKGVREETGLTRTATEGLEQSLGQSYKNTAALGASMDDVAKAASSFSTAFANTEQATLNTRDSIITMQKNFGVMPEEAANVNKLFQNIAGVSQGTAQALSEQVVSLADQNKVAPGQVMKDISDNAENAGRFFRGNTKALTQQAIQAAKLGTSLTEALEISKGLLDYDNSINAELEASAILNTNLNFSNARALAASGNYLDAQREIVKQTQKTVDLNNLNMYEAEALEKATGMTVVQMQNLARVEEMKNKLGEDGVALLGEEIKSGKDLSKLSDEQLAAKTKELQEQKNIQTSFDNLKASMMAGAAGIMTAFAPLGELLMPIFEFMGGVVYHIGNGLGMIVNFLTEAYPLVIALAGAFAIVKAKAIGAAIVKIFGSFAQIPLGLGIPLAIAAVAGMISMVSSYSKKDDVAIPGAGSGYGKRVISAPEGTFALNDKDTILAGTNLGQDTKEPSLFDRIKGRIQQRREERAFSRAEMNLAPLLQKMDTLIAATKGKQVLVADGRQIANTTANQQEVSLKNQFGLNSSVAT